MKHFLKIIFALGFLCLFSLKVFAQDYLTGSIMKAPDEFYGLWRVTSELIDTDSYENFKQKGVDIWNISEVNNVIILDNPFSGAKAELKIENVVNNEIVFSKTGTIANRKLLDKVTIYISGNSFTGTDVLQLETQSEIDGHVIKTNNAKYVLKGEKIAGNED